MLWPMLDTRKAETGMAKPYFSTALIALTLSSTVAVAQDTGTTSDLDMGVPLQKGERPLGERYLKETFNDWQLACIASQLEQDPCSMLQLMLDPNGQPMAEITLFRLAEGPAAAAATVIVPLETLLPAQMTIAIGDNLGKRYGYEYCTPVGCVAQIGLTEEDIALMKAEDEAVVSIVPAPAPDQRIDLRLSLSGFTAAYNVVDVVEN